jgi:hypothetical protein
MRGRQAVPERLGQFSQVTKQPPLPDQNWLRFANSRSKRMPADACVLGGAELWRPSPYSGLLGSTVPAVYLQ